MSVCQGVPVFMDGLVTRLEFSTVSRIQYETERESMREGGGEKGGSERKKERKRASVKGHRMKRE